MTFDSAAHLPDDLIERIRDRAPAVDAENTFPVDDLDELRASGYLAMLVPSDRGGHGLGLAEASVLQRRLAGAAPATALAVNMHLVWTGVAKILQDRGIDDLAFVERAAARGELFAFGISEAGNDLVLFGSDTTAAPTGDGGYAFTGTKIFTSLAPVWDHLGVHGLDTSEPDAPRLVFAFIDRESSTADGSVITRDDWDTVGMRGTQSRTTELHGATADATRVVRRIPVGPSADPLVFGIFAAFELLLASVYTGIGERALELAVRTAQARRSKRTGRALDQDPDIRARIGGMALRLDGIRLELAQLTRDVDESVDHGADWFRLLSGMKHRAVVAAKTTVDDAMLVAGGSSFFTRSELSRLYRDVMAGMYHPSDPESAHATAAQSLLGPVADG